MQIGGLAKQGGISVQTVRYYERCGLLTQTERKASGYRVYGEKDVHRLQFILHAKKLGFTLEEIKRILQLREQRACPCGEVRKIGEEHLANLEAQIAELTKFRNQLARAVRQWKNSPDEAPSEDAICVLIERTMMEKPPRQFTRREKNTMPFKQGEVYKCPDPQCGCEVTVTKGPAPTCAGTAPPRCCCGKDMVKKQ